MIEIMQKGGPLMWPILLCSIFSMTIFLERFLHFYRAQIDIEKFMDEVREIVQHGKIKEAVEICHNTPGPIAHILKAGILKYDSNSEQIQKSIEDAAHQEIPKLEKNLSLLASIAHVAPLLGLLGTVTGMIRAFQAIQQTTSMGMAVNPGVLAGGISEALLTTAAGLMVAIPTYVAYNYLMNRVNHMVVEMEQTSTELVDILIAGGQK